jgi:HEAT repeat protein
MGELTAALLAIEGRDERRRAEAAQQICEMASEVPLTHRQEFVSCVVRFIGDAQSELRCAGLALSVLVLSPAEAREVLVRHLTDRDVRVRIEACGRLADLNDPATRGALAVGLNDVSFSVKFEAARGMALLKHSAGLETLLQGLDHKDFRFRAAGSLALLQDPAALPKLKQVFAQWLVPHFDRTQIASALSVLGDRSGVEHLMSRARGRESNVDRPMAIQYLGELSIQEAKQTLLEIVKNKKDTARGTAARALGMLGGEDAVELLCQLLNDVSEFEDIRLDAAVGLFESKSERGRVALKTCTFSSPEAQQEIAQLLEGS